MERILAIDYGRRRIGLAISDAMGFAAHGLPTLQVKNKSQALEKTLGVIQEQQPDGVIVGLPLNLDGSKGEMAQLVEHFITQLEQAVEVPISTIDERLTSVAAHKTMQEMGIRHKGHKDKVDQLSAVYLLEIYLQQRTP